MDQTEQPQPHEDTAQGRTKPGGGTQHELQQCIDLIFAEHEGKTVTELCVLLGDAVEATGHPRPPVPWLTAVSGQIAAGQRYITGLHAGG